MTEQTSQSAVIPEKEFQGLHKVARERNCDPLLEGWSGFVVALIGIVKLYRNYRVSYPTLKTRNEKLELVNDARRVVGQLSRKIESPDLINLMIGYEWKQAYLNVVARELPTGLIAFAEAEAVKQLLDCERATIARLAGRLAQLEAELTKTDQTVDEQNKSSGRKDPPKRVLDERVYKLLTQRGVKQTISSNSTLVVLANEIIRISEGVDHMDHGTTQKRMTNVRKRLNTVKN